MHRKLIVVLAVFIGLTSFESAAAQTPNQTSAAPAATKNDYSDGKTWLCRPGRQDACAVDLSTTVVTADGKLSIEKWSANPKAAIDCFYVYPTVSNDPTPNSDMNARPHFRLRALPGSRILRSCLHLVRDQIECSPAAER